MKNTNKKYFYGIYGIEFIWHGNWSDPELIWHGKSFNYYELEMALWEDFKDEYPDNSDDELFPVWVKKHAPLCREYLQNLMDYNCFYGG